MERYIFLSLHSSQSVALWLYACERQTLKCTLSNSSFEATVMAKTTVIMWGQN